MEQIICAKQWAKQLWADRQPIRKTWYGRINAIVLKQRGLKPLSWSNDELKHLGLSPQASYRAGGHLFHQWVDKRGITTAVGLNMGGIAGFETMFSDGTAIVSSPTSIYAKKLGSQYLTYKSVVSGYRRHEQAVEARLRSGYNALQRKTLEQQFAYSEWYNMFRASRLLATLTLTCLVPIVAIFVGLIMNMI